MSELYLANLAYLSTVLSMPRRNRGVVKNLAAFGEKQFNDTGASRVEVLRVKASTIRKHFKKLKGIRFLVSVVYLDRVRIYFFTEKGAMLIGENVNSVEYEDIRSKSRLIKKFEKPTPPTELEVRMELTEEFRELLSRSIKKVARYLNQSVPDFPDIYLTSEDTSSSGQGFGLSFDDEGALLVDQGISDSKLAEGIALRIALLSHLTISKAKMSIVQTLGNSISCALLDEELREDWKARWLKESKGTNESKFVFHFIKHIPVYKKEGFSRILSFIKEAPAGASLTDWEDALTLLHNSFESSLGTGAAHTLAAFCRDLDNVNYLTKEKNTFPDIHLAPRPICNPIPLGYSLGLVWFDEINPNEEAWFSVSLKDGAKNRAIGAVKGDENRIESYEYYLNLSDAFPKTTGLGSHGKDILNWALEKMGISRVRASTFTTSLSFRDITASKTELAVLKRLATGDLEILMNSLIGSPKRISSLIHSGGLAIIPDFNHIGLKSNLLIRYDNDIVAKIIRQHCLEMTRLKTLDESYSIVCAPSEWGTNLLSALSSTECSVWPIVKCRSSRKWLRDEIPFVDKK